MYGIFRTLRHGTRDYDVIAAQPAILRIVTYQSMRDARRIKNAGIHGVISGRLFSGDLSQLLDSVVDQIASRTIR